MKVLFTFGGMPHYLVSQLNGIQDKGIEVITVIPAASAGRTIGKGVKQSFSDVKFKLVYLEEYNTIYKKPFLRGLKQLIVHEKPDIVVTLWPYILGFLFHPALLCYIKLKKIKLTLKDIPFMVAPFNSCFSYYKQNPVYDENMNYESLKGIKFYIKYGFLAILRKIYYNILDGTLNYSHIAFDIQSSYGMKKERIFITLNSPETNLIFEAKKKLMLNENPLEYNPYRLIHVGRLVKWKKVDLLIKALNIIAKEFPNPELLIVGDGPEKNELEKITIELNLYKHVKFVGGIYDYDSLGNYFNTSAIYVLAGMGGLSINEAMAFGKPVICSVSDGTEKFLVREGFNGMFFKDDDYKDLAEKIKYLFKNPSLIKEYGENSEKIIRDEVNINIVVNNFLNAFYTIKKFN
jgi:glycosyltransferase involved in cell wall biosynthesis